MRINQVMSNKKQIFRTFTLLLVITIGVMVLLIKSSTKPKYEISENDFISISGKQQYLTLKMVEGNYYEEKSPGAYMGTIWEGSFILELKDEAKNIISKFDLSSVYREPMIFHAPFDIQFDDYNNDGDTDFTLGQYASSNGNEYKLFTIRQDGTIEELPIKGYSALFISKTTGLYSTRLTKLDDITFKIEYYDNIKRENIEEIFRWDGKVFISLQE